MTLRTMNDTARRLVYGALAASALFVGAENSLAETATAKAQGKTASAESDSSPSLDEIEERLRRLRARADSKAAQGALAQANRAIMRGRALEAEGKHSAAERAKQIAWAALVLSTQRISWAQEAAAFRRAQRRAQVAKKRARAARSALLSDMRKAPAR